MMNDNEIKSLRYGPSPHHVRQVERAAKDPAPGQLKYALEELMTEAFQRGWEDNDKLRIEETIADERYKVRVALQCPSCNNRDEIQITAPPCSAACGQRMTRLLSPTRVELRDVLRIAMTGLPSSKFIGERSDDRLDALAEAMERLLARSAP